MPVINVSIDPESQEPDIPRAAPDDMQYDKTEALIDDSFKNLSRKSFRDLLQSLAREKLGGPDIKVVSYESILHYKHLRMIFWLT